jgi:hypothetical protein
MSAIKDGNLLLAGENNDPARSGWCLLAAAVVAKAKKDLNENNREGCRDAEYFLRSRWCSQLYTMAETELSRLKGHAPAALLLGDSSLSSVESLS